MSDRMLEAALAYARRGWPVFPVKFNKQPHTQHGVLDASTDEVQIREWWTRWPNANIALHPDPAGFVVIDEDPGSSEDQIAERFGEEYFETGLVAKTPRGGRHCYFAKIGSERYFNSAGQIADHVDVRSFNGYVLLPPSRTADGAYTWESESAPLEIPARLADACRKSYQVKHEDRDDWTGINIDSDEHVAEAIAWATNEARPAVENHGGDHATYAAAAMMRSLGLSEETALEVMHEHYNPRCVPPWDHDELATKVRNAYTYAENPPGNCTAEYKVRQAQKLFQPVVVQPETGGSIYKVGRFTILDRDAIHGMEPPPWLLDQFMPAQSYAMIYGPPNDGKTFVALDMALSLATEPADLFEQTTVWGPTIRERGAVLFLAGEGQFGIKKRVAAWEHHHGLRVPNRFLLGHPVPHVMTDPEHLEALVAELRGLSPNGYKLVVLDTVTRALSGESQTHDDVASAFTDMVRGFIEGLGCTVLALHHTNAAGDRLRGSSVFEGDADMICALSNDRGKVTLKMEKQKDAELAPPKLIQLTEVQYSKTGKSLVAVPVSQEECEQIEEKEQTTNKARAEERQMRRDRTGHYLAQFLKERGHEDRNFSDRAAAKAIQALATEDDEELGTEKTIATYLSDLRGIKPYNKLWDRNKRSNSTSGGWKWHPEFGQI